MLTMMTVARPITTLSRSGLTKCRSPSACVLNDGPTHVVAFVQSTDVAVNLQGVGIQNGLVDPAVQVSARGGDEGPTSVAVISISSGRHSSRGGRGGG